MHYQRRSARIGQHYLLTPKLTSGQWGHESVKSCQGWPPSHICAIVVQPQIWKQRRWIQSSLYILEIYFWGWRLSRWQVGLSGNLVASSVLPRNWIGNSSLHPGGDDDDDANDDGANDNDDDANDDYWWEGSATHFFWLQLRSLLLLFLCPTVYPG